MSIATKSNNLGLILTLAMVLQRRNRFKSCFLCYNTVMDLMISDWFERHVASTHLFLSGLVVMPSFVLQRSLLLKSLCIFLYAVLCFFLRRRTKPVLSVIRSAILVICITLAHLLTPAGRILARVGGFPITSLALESGLYRGLTLAGLFYISSFYVRRDIRLPGIIGMLLGRIFYYFNLLVSRSPLDRQSPIEFDPRKPIESIDRILVETYGHRQKEDSPDPRTSIGGYCMLSLLVVLGWSLIFIDRFL